MIQNGGALAREMNPISLISAVQTATRADYVAVAEREVTMSTIQRTWMFEAAEKAPVERIHITRANPLSAITRWLNYLGNRRLDDSYLKSNQNIPRNFGVGGFGL